MEDSSSKFREIFEKSPIGILFYDKEGKLIEANQSALEIAGITSLDEVRGIYLFDNPHVASRKEKLFEKGLIKFQASLDLDNIKNIGFYTPRESGNVFIDYIVSITDTGFLVQIQDITEHKKTEEYLEFQSNLFDNVSDAVIATDENFIITSWNDAAERIYGWNENEVIGKKVSSILKSDLENNEVNKAIKVVSEAGKLITQSTHHKRDGTPIYIEGNTVTLYDKKGKINGYLSVNRDITDYRKSEEEIKYQAFLLGQVNDAVIGVDSNFKITYWNKGAAQMYGFKESEALGKTTIELLKPTYAPGEREKIINELEHYSNSKSIITTKRQNGTEVIVEANSTRLTDDSGSTLGYVVIYRDITKRKKAEEALKESEERFSKAFSFSPVGVVITRLSDGCYIDVNETWNELYKYGRSEVIGHTSLELNVVEPNERAKFLQILKEKGTIRNYEIPTKTKTGEVLIILISMNIINFNGQDHILTTFVDITEEKKAEEQIKKLLEETQQFAEELEVSNEELQATTEELHVSNEELQETTEELHVSNEELRHQGDELLQINKILQESEERFRSILDNLQDAYFRGDDKGKIIMASHSAARMYGFGSPEEIIGLPVISMYGNREDRDLVLEELKKHGKVENYEAKALRKDGTFFLASQNAQFYYDDTGQIQGTEALVRDITESKKTESALRESESQFQALIHNLQSGVALVDETGRFVVVNPSFLRMFGLDSELNILNVNSQDWGLWKVYGEDNKLLHVDEHPVRKATITGKPVKNQLVGVRNPGANRLTWMMVSAEPILNKDGSISRIICTYYDITDRKKAEEELKKRAALLDVSYEAIFSWEYEKGILSWNQGAERLYGYTGKEAIGKVSHDLLKTKFPLDFNEFMEKLDNEKIWTGELIHTTKNGKEIIVESRHQLIQDSSGKKIVIETNRDITLRKQMEEELRKSHDNLEEKVEERTMEIEEAYQLVKENEYKLKESIDELERSNKELESFAYITSHDLQEPLRSIASYSQLIERRYKGRLDSDADEFIEFMVSGAKRMKSMIQGLLEYSRVGTQGGVFKDFNAEEALETALTNLKSTIQECHVEVLYDPLPVIHADESQISRVFQNLIGNALKFQKKDVQPQIHIKAKKEGNEYLFSVQDNGIGMEKEYSDRIFEVFKRLHPIGEYEGTGIGLAIVKRIIERHGGRVWVESEFGVGSTFYFTIPIKD